MLAECGLCGWTQEVDSEQEGVAEYARHVIDRHPERIPHDAAVMEFIRMKVGYVATTNGRPY